MEAALAGIPAGAARTSLRVHDRRGRRGVSVPVPPLRPLGRRQAPQTPAHPAGAKAVPSSARRPQVQRVIAEDELGRISETSRPSCRRTCSPGLCPARPPPSAIGWVDRSGNPPSPDADAPHDPSTPPPLSPSGATSCSQGRQPLDPTHQQFKAPAGRRRSRLPRITPARGALRAAHRSPPPQRLPLQPPTSVAKNAFRDKTPSPTPPPLTTLPLAARRQPSSPRPLLAKRSYKSEKSAGSGSV